MYKCSFVNKFDKIIFDLVNVCLKFILGINKMSEGVLFALSNSSTDIYPDNTRSSYTNKLPRTISVSKVGVNGLWLSLESLAIENSIIPYKKSEEADIITYEEKNVLDKEFKTFEEFFIPQRWFENTRSFISFLQRECVSLFKKIGI